MAKRGIPMAAVERALHEVDADIRISDSAKIEMLRYLEGFGESGAQKARQLAEHAGRKTIKERDIRLAESQVSNT